MENFSMNNSDIQELADAYNSGNYASLPQSKVLSNYQQFLQNTPSNEVSDLHQQYFEQMPQVERMGLFQSLVGALQQHGVDPRQAGVSTTDPRQASPFDLSNLFNFALNSGLLGNMMGGGHFPTSNQQGQPNQGGGFLGNLVGNLFGGGSNQNQAAANNDPYARQSQSGSGLQGLLSNPMAQAAISGLVGYLANRALNGMVNRGQQPYQQQYQSQQPQQSDYYYQQPNSQPNSGQNNTTNQPGGGSALPGFENDNRSL